MPPPSFNIKNAQNGPILPVNMCKVPQEGPRVCQFKLVFNGDGVNYNVSLNQGQIGGASMSQINSLFIDNTRCNQILSIQFADSGQIIQVPGYTRQWVNVLTGGLSFLASMATDVFEATVEIQACNFNVAESSDTITFVDGLVESFIYTGTTLSTWAPGTSFVILGAGPPASIHLTEITINRSNFGTVSTTGLAGQAELWQLKDDSNPTVTLANIILPINNPNTFVSDFNIAQPLAPNPSATPTPWVLPNSGGECGFSKKDINYITAQPSGNIILVNDGQSHYSGSGFLIVTARYGYYTFPTFT